ncbi:xanthine phosphoribosyltransferase [Erysipelothrix sp. HDW6C]|uniref:phosphoribosyltransferase family protein n=1 Tax=Erysipelothrix sp. HDW6C TaxID=2714930 RepID=UPI00140D9009|nr:phosphoribosyltransferase family protein [Erysipelothrix sp. HDW6C]QIK69639.1 xanthine phosphoribosyltransferase [Erysipelothrix sp. HDW6C]
MDLLKTKIQSEGIARTTEILDVSTFFNAGVDAVLMDAIGKDFAEKFKNEDFDVFATVESSGIAPAVFASLYADKPLVIIKKNDKELDSEVYVQQASFSFTKNNHYYLTSRKFLLEGKRVILIDDFLAQGSVVTNVEALLHKVNADLVAIGICISKNYQPGYQTLIDAGRNLYCQVQLASLDPETNSIIFA